MCNHPIGACNCPTSTCSCPIGVCAHRGRTSSTWWFIPCWPLQKYYELRSPKKKPHLNLKSLLKLWWLCLSKFNHLLVILWVNFSVSIAVTCNSILRVRYGRNTLFVVAGVGLRDSVAKESICWKFFKVNTKEQTSFVSSWLTVLQWFWLSFVCWSCHFLHGCHTRQWLLISYLFSHQVKLQWTSMRRAFKALSTQFTKMMNNVPALRAFFVGVFLEVAMVCTSKLAAWTLLDDSDVVHLLAPGYDIS